MALNTLHASWHPVTFHPPSARCGHICVVVDKTDEFGTELIVFHGGVSASKEALDDLSVLQVESEEWLPLETAMVGPAARAFHAACVAGHYIFIFAGHVYLPEQKRLHQFNDLWALNTDTWEWHRQEASPDAPQPIARDRASIVTIDTNHLLVYGGADATGKRLDDAWIYDLKSSTWREMAISGAKPRPRCCTTLFSMGNRVLLFGGDLLGVSNELWSLRGLDGKSSVQWTLLQLDGGSVPAPRRGHAAALSDNLGVVIVGGFSEQKFLLGMKKQDEYLMDVVLLQRLKDSMVWRAVEAVNEVPVAREKHTLCALRNGRFLLYGGTDGTTTLGDAWWLEVEDIAPPPPPELISFSDLEKQMESATPAPVPPTSSSLEQQQATATSSEPQQQQDNASAASYWAVLPTSLQSVPSLATAVPSGLTSALSSLRGRFGLPAVVATSGVQGSAAHGNSVMRSALEDEGLMEVGRGAVHVGTTGSTVGSTMTNNNNNNNNNNNRNAHEEWSPEVLVQAARDYFSTCSPNELKLGSIPALLYDYKRLARVGWAAALSELGPEGLASAELALPGRFLHFSVDDVRLKDVAAILDDYRTLMAAASMPQSGQIEQMDNEPEIAPIT